MRMRGEGKMKERREEGKMEKVERERPESSERTGRDYVTNYRLFR